MTLQGQSHAEMSSATNCTVLCFPGDRINQATKCIPIASRRKQISYCDKKVNSAFQENVNVLILDKY